MTTITQQLEIQKNSLEKVDIILDTDAYNEIDDLYAISYMVMSEERFHIKGILAAPFYSPAALGRTRKNASPEEGMLQSYRQIMDLLDVMERSDMRELVKQGSRRFLPDERHPVLSEAAKTIVELAGQHDPGNPLYVVGIAALTDIASALLIAPEIRERIVVVWLGGDSYENRRFEDFNAIQDVAAVRAVFDSGAPIVQLPCRGVVSDFAVTGEELRGHLAGRNRLCDYLVQTSADFMLQKEHSHVWRKPLWDVTALAWLQKERYMDGRPESGVIFEYDHRYTFDKTRKPINYIYHIHRDPLMRDMFERLGKTSRDGK